MKIHFTLPYGYKSRPVGLVLARVGSGWQFAGVDRNGLLVVPRNSRGHALFEGVRFATRREAHMAAAEAILPEYPTWDRKNEMYGDVLYSHVATPRNSPKRPDGSEYGEDFDIVKDEE